MPELNKFKEDKKKKRKRPLDNMEDFSLQKKSL